MERNTGWKRIVYLMCAIQVGAGIAMIGVMAFLPLFLGEIGVTDAGEAAFWAGLISGVTPFMIALSAPFWSIQADRRGPKLVMSIVLAAVTLTAFLCAVSTSPWQVFIFRLLQGLVGGFVPIGLSVIASVSPEEETSRTLGYFQAAMVSGIMFGPLVGGLVADTLGYRMPFVFFGVLSLLCLICLRLFMPEIHRKGASGEKSSTWQELKYFAAIPRVRLMVGIQFLCNFGITGIGPILPLYIKDMLGGGLEIIATIVGIIIFLAGGASALCSLSTGAVTARVSLPRLLTAATVFVGLTFIMQYMMTNVWGLGFFRAVTGIGMGFIMPVANTLIAQAVPSEKRSIVFGVVSSVVLMGNVAGPVCSGALAMVCGYAAVFWSTAVAFLAAGIVVYINFKDEINGNKEI